jgi:thiamine biosynthesis lipoprotein
MTRARPLLGTVVAVRADGGEPALRSAFAAIERVQALMNFHAAEGDVARINRARSKVTVAVHPWTFRVLRKAKEVSKYTCGAFDVTAPGSAACHADIELLDGYRVRLRRCMRIDLGGIAKGFAVDMAVQALRRNGARHGSVNAGGDLRRFGRWDNPLRVRIPDAPWRSVVLPSLAHEAIATSGSYFGGGVNRGCTGGRVRLTHSVTVCAANCMTADALTKAVALLGPLTSLLERFSANAFAIGPDGRLYAPAR